MKNNIQNILIVDPDDITGEQLSKFLSSEGFGCKFVESYDDAIKRLQKSRFCVMLLEINLPDGLGQKLLQHVRKTYPQTTVVIITKYGTIENAVSSIKDGAYDYLTKPIIDDELRIAVHRALGQHRIMCENEDLKHQLEKKHSLDNIISQNYKMSKIFELVEAVAETKTNILMTGPSGTGKSMLARAIHHHSARKSKPFVEVSCGALPETLLESELFGHVKGSFTGAISNKPGKFLAADGGTIFLDEISNASQGLQVKLLRIIQERQFEAVGSNKTETVDTRIIAASNKNLAELVAKGIFREDLYYRINVVSIELPPLRDRIGDISLLANHFLENYSEQHGKVKLGFTDSATAMLERYGWPGNIRELENVVEQAVLISKGKYIDVDGLPALRDDEQIDGRVQQVSLKDALAGSEKIIIRRALEQNHWNRQVTAKTLDINRTTLFKKMKKYDLYDEAEKLGLI